MGQLDSALLDLKDRFNRSIVEQMLKTGQPKQKAIRAPRFTLHLNDLCHQISINPDTLDVDYVKTIVDAGLDTAGLDQLIILLRQSFSHTAWPISIEFRLSGLTEGGWTHQMSEISGISVANQMFRNTQLCPLLIKGRMGSIEGGLDAFAEGLDMMSQILPPSNTPVRAWSIVNNICGEHVRIMDMYARDELEFLLKKRLFRKGSPAIRKIIEDGKFELENNEAGQRLISAEIEDLDLLPLGRRKRVMSIADELNDFLKSRLTEPELDELEM